MTKFERAAKAAVLARLNTECRPVTLFSVSCWADQAAREAGRKTELYRSLYDYANLLPGGWRSRWLTSGSGSTRMLHACPATWQAGGSPRTLAMDPGTLRPADLDWGCD